MLSERRRRCCGDSCRPCRRAARARAPRRDRSSRSGARSGQIRLWLFSGRSTIERSRATLTWSVMAAVRRAGDAPARRRRAPASSSRSDQSPRAPRWCSEMIPSAPPPSRTGVTICAPCRRSEPSIALERRDPRTPRAQSGWTTCSAPARHRLHHRLALERHLALADQACRCPALRASCTTGKVLAGDVEAQRAAVDVDLLAQRRDDRVERGRAQQRDVVVFGHRANVKH